MTRIRRPRVHKQLVALDTNILWHKDKDVVVAPEFEQFWDSHAGHFDLELLVPEVVRGELLFQQTTSALNSLRRANEALAEASKVCSATYGHRVTEARVKRDVQTRLDAWLKQRRARVIPVPVGAVDWNSMIDASIWRTGPFAVEAKGALEEKGFRDALILESVLTAASGLSSQRRLAFVSNDRLLRNATQARFGSALPASTFESLKDLSSFLRLLDEKLTQQFVATIQSRVRDRFFSPGDSTCLYLANDVPGRIKREYSSDWRWFGDSNLLFTSPQASGGLLSIFNEPEWVPLSQEKVWLTNPTFRRLEGTQDFHWSSQVRWLQLFRRERSGLLAHIASPEERLRSLKYDVNWHAQVLGNGRIKSAQITDIVLAERSFAVTSDEELAALRLARLTPVAVSGTV